MLAVLSVALMILTGVVYWASDISIAATTWPTAFVPPRRGCAARRTGCWSRPGWQSCSP